MKRKSLILSNIFSGINLRHLAVYGIVLLMIQLFSGLNADAQRHRGERGERGEHRHPSWHYAKMPPRGAYFHRVPRASARIFYRGHDFYFRNGLYYRPYHAGFTVATPPWGIRIRVLPRGFLRFHIGGIPYFYYCGTYYIQREGQYEVVAPPVGALVESIPQGYNKVVIDGETYYTVDGVQYKAVLRNGEIWYQVISSPASSPDYQPE